MEKGSEYYKYMATLREEHDKSVYTNYPINNINLDEYDKLLDDYVITHNRKFYFYFIKLTFKLKVNNGFIPCIETN